MKSSRPPLEKALDRLSATPLSAACRIGRPLFLFRRLPRKLADRRQVKRWPVTASVVTPRCPNPGLRRSHREMAQHFRRPYVDRGEGEGREQL
jgi:hypothetical protein